MRFMSKKCILKQGKLELLYEGNHLQRKMAKEKEMGRKKFSDSEGREALLQALQEIRAR
jgi:hypothetical protein